MKVHPLLQERFIRETKRPTLRKNPELLAKMQKEEPERLAKGVSASANDLMANIAAKKHIAT